MCIASCTEDKSIRKIENIEDDIPIHTIWDFSMIIMDSSHTKAQVRSAMAIVHEKQQETILDSAVVVDFMNVNSQRVGNLIADSARIDDRTRNMFAYGKVKVTSDSTRTSLVTSALMWDNAKQTLFTTEKVHIVTPTEIIDGTGLESDQYLKNYKIFRVSGIKQLH